MFRRLLRSAPRPGVGWRWPCCWGARAAATVGLLAGSGYWSTGPPSGPGSAPSPAAGHGGGAGLPPGPLRYGERLVGHDAAFRALTGWRVWLYDRLEPLAPAGLRAWRSGDLLARATDDVDVLQDLYLRGLAPVAVAAA